MRRTGERRSRCYARLKKETRYEKNTMPCTSDNYDFFACWKDHCQAGNAKCAWYCMVAALALAVTLLCVWGALKLRKRRRSSKRVKAR
jgi:hypothetical protein